MDNIILLTFDKIATRLAGNPYGRAVFEEQVKDKLDYNKLNIIVFPEPIEKIASSFTQGFFADIVNKVGYYHFNDVIKIETKSEKLTEIVYSDLMM